MEDQREAAYRRSWRLWRRADPNRNSFEHRFATRIARFLPQPSVNPSPSRIIRVSNLVKISRELSSDADEVPAGTFGGSFRYWLQRGPRNRMIFGVNVAGGRRSPPLG